MGQDGLPRSFNIYWGSIDALMTNPDGTPRYDNTLTVFTIPSVNTQDSVTGSQLAAAGVFGVNGFGDQFSANDNQWFNIRDTAGPILFFTASSTQNAFEFDMGSTVPEPSTWAMMMLGFVGLGYAAFRRGAKARRPRDISRGPTETLKAAYGRPSFVPANPCQLAACGSVLLCLIGRVAENRQTATPPRSHRWAWFRA